MKIKHELLCFLLLLSFTFLAAQDSTIIMNNYPCGLTVAYGFGSYAVTDEYISTEKYSGSMPYFSANWSRGHNNYIYSLDLIYQNSGDIKNNNVSADITQFVLNQGFLYSVGKVSAWKRDILIWLGPTSEFFIYYNDQKVAVSGFDYAQSLAGLFSLGLRSDFVYSWSKRINIESSINLSVLSLGFRMVDSEETNDSPVKLLTALNGINGSFNFGVRYNILDCTSVKAVYRLGLARISAWNPLLSASDHFVISLNYQF